MLSCCNFCCRRDFRYGICGCYRRVRVRIRVRTELEPSSKLCSKFENLKPLIIDVFALLVLKCWQVWDVMFTFSDVMTLLLISRVYNTMYFTCNYFGAFGAVKLLYNRLRLVWNCSYFKGLLFRNFAHAYVYLLKLHMLGNLCGLWQQHQRCPCRLAPAQALFYQQS